MKLTINLLKEEAINFCKYESTISHEDLLGITDGKAIGTYIEHKFEEYLKNKYEVTIGSSAKGVDLPDPHINTDIKVTSVTKPQNSSPFKNIEQKIYGLGYNLLIFVYKKIDTSNNCYLGFKHCIFIEAEKSGDYNLTKILRKMIELGAKESDIVEILDEQEGLGDKEILIKLARKILSTPPKQGYLTISNAFQWRIKYNQIFKLKNSFGGIYTNEKYNEKELSEYQTPLFFTDTVCDYLKKLEINPTIIIDPTCGIGNFLKSAARVFHYKQIYGIEIDKEKLNLVDNSIKNINLINEDIFKFNFNMINKNDSYLILGNLPWSANVKISELNSKNIKTDTPYINIPKTNNFDISKEIILKIIDEFKNTKTTIAFICKRKVSKKVFKEVIKNNISYNFVKQINFSYSKYFKLEDEACLFILQFGKKRLKDNICEVSDFSDPEKILYKLSFESRNSSSNIQDIIDIDGPCEMIWQEGIKHDCAKIIELTNENNQFKNNLDETVLIEDNLLYPLFKSRNLKKPIVNKTSMYIIITQQKLKQDTSYIKTKLPKTWDYLNKNKDFFNKRKSKMYKNTPNFSIFGIGDYSFKKYKVAISNFKKDPKFSLIYSEKPAMLDNTCYYLSFDDFDEAYISMLILNSQLVKNFLKNIAFLESKRPFSKKILKRIDIRKCLKILSLEDLKKIEKELNIDEIITPEKFLKYKNKYCKPL